MKINCWFLFLSCIFPLLSFSQNNSFKEITILSDTNLFSYSKNAIQYRNEKYLFFTTENAKSVCELTLYPQDDSTVVAVNILPSPDFVLLDSVRKIGNHFRTKIQFNNLAQSQYLGFLFNIENRNKSSHTEELKLFPYFLTKVTSDNSTHELFLGEEKTINLPATNANAINISGEWIKTADFDYLLSIGENGLNIKVHPNTTGNKELVLKLKTKKPFLNSYNQLSFDLPPFTLKLSVKPSKLQFINADKQQFFFDDKDNISQELLIGYSKDIEIGKTYLIENQLEPGGRLIAELFPESVIGNNEKILCALHTYSLHQTVEGYLYVKLQDMPVCITNFNIMRKPTLEKIYVLRDGDDWMETRIVYPGENIEVKIEGNGLTNAQFKFDGCVNVKSDSSKKFDDVSFYSLTVPINISEKRIAVLMNGKPTKFELIVKEYQRPKNFDFVSVNYDDKPFPFTSSVFSKPVMVQGAIKDVNISFNRNLIDHGDTLYGKQYLCFEIRLYNNKNDLIEYQKIENVVVCPGEMSPRNSFYDKTDCFNSTINVNDYLLHKTYTLSGWSKIEITASHVASKYTEPGYTGRTILIKQEFTSFDLRVSFPTGLLTKRFNKSGIGDLSGLSTAFLGQFSFYDHNSINRLKPYNVGAGFIALNIFNPSSDNLQSDVGAVVIGSFLPLKQESKFNFPLYFGFGYLLKANSIFAVLGPGIEFSF